MKKWKAIAAMSENRVIGAAGKIPWHIPEEFKWFKEVTMGHILVMGRKTFASIGRPLPGRATLVLTRQNWSFPGVQVVRDLSEIQARTDQEIFIAGGAEIYALALPYCAELYLTVIRQAVKGDTFFPDFETDFERRAVLREEEKFSVEHWVNRKSS